jgi:hypothetical protein
MMMDTKETIEVRELTDEELKAVAAGTACATGAHYNQATMTTGTTGTTNAWQDWMQTYFSV